MADGARSSAWGLRYQYLRTLEALMDAVEDHAAGVEAVHVEGRPGLVGADLDSIDYELSDASGKIVSAVQVKARGAGSLVGAGQIFGVLAGLVSDREASQYGLLINAEPGDSARDLVSALGSGQEAGALRAAIDIVLASVSAGKRQAQLRRLKDEHLARLSRVHVDFDRRDDAEISEGLRARLRWYRDRHRAGLGDESAGLLIGYLVSEIFRRAGNAIEATLSVSNFRSLILVEGATLARTLGKRDWGVMIGSLPAVPDVRRADVLDLVHSALPLTSGNGAIPRCALTGMSGIGKSSLAAGYVLDRADIYDVIFWVDAESEQALASSFVRILRYLRGGESSLPADSAHLRDMVLSDLSCAAGRWLLILDNCVSRRIAEKWIPRKGSGHIILTTTDSASPPRAGSQVGVEGMTVPQAVELLRRRLAPAGEPDGPQLKQLVRLARELEGWPLALELASSYLHGSGLGIGGIPEYLRRLMLCSLGDPDSVPSDYPRTLIQAIDLCVQRIRKKAEAQDFRDGWAPIKALGVLRIAAYVASRQIPVYLVLSVPEIDLNGEEAFLGPNPIVADHPDYPPAEVVRTLRAQSLVAIDERLPPSRSNCEDDLQYDYTISINSVLQEVMRSKFDNDSATGFIIDRLAWHTERWMKAALELGAQERVQTLATHAAALEGHAARLNLKSDFIAYLRGNLASIHILRNANEQAAQFLRSEIGHYRGRDDEHAQLLICQASIQLAVVLAVNKAESADEIANLLETAYFILLKFVSHNPVGIAFLVSNIRTILSNLELNGVRQERLTKLATAVNDLAGMLPATRVSMALSTLDEIATCMHEYRDCGRAAELAKGLLTQDFLTEDTQETIQIRCAARSALVEAMVGINDLENAFAELDQFICDARPAAMFVRQIEDLVHNAGLHCALLTLAGNRLAGELLSRLLSDGRAELVMRSFPAETSERIRLLCGIDAFNHGDLYLALQSAEEFLANQDLNRDQSAQRRGWLKVANMLSDAVTIQRAKEEGLIGPTTPLRDASGFSRFVRFASHVQDTLTNCEIELLPLHAVLAVVHSNLSGPPGSRCVPVCYHLQGGLEHLGFDSEVIAASAMVLRTTDDAAERVGDYHQEPMLRDDGSTDGHTVLWASSFGQLVDPTIGQARHLQEAAEDNPRFSFPVVLPIASREILVGPWGIGTTSRPPLHIAWVLQPQFTSALRPVLGSDLETSLTYGKLALAHTTLEVLRSVEELRSDFKRLRTLYPQIAALLDGRRQLPELPATGFLPVGC